MKRPNTHLTNPILVISYYTVCLIIRVNKLGTRLANILVVFMTGTYVTPFGLGKPFPMHPASWSTQVPVVYHGSVAEETWRINRRRYAHDYCSTDPYVCSQRVVPSF